MIAGLARFVWSGRVGFKPPDLDLAGLAAHNA